MQAAKNSRHIMRDAPTHMIRKATRYIKDLSNSVVSDNHKRDLVNIAEKRRWGIISVVESNRKRTNLFKQLEKLDSIHRQTLQSLINQKDDKGANKKKAHLQLTKQNMHLTNSKVQQTLQKHHTQQRNYQATCQSRMKLLTETMEVFHNNSVYQRSSRWKRLETLKPSFNQAQINISLREASSRMFSLKTQKDLEKSMAKKHTQPNPELQTSVSKRNNRVSHYIMQIKDTIRKASQFNSIRQQEFMRSCHDQLQRANFVRQKKHENNEKRSQKIKDFLKLTLNRAREKNKLIQDQRTPQKVQDKLVSVGHIQNKSNQNSFHFTSTSSFRETCRSLAAKNSIRRSYLKKLEGQRSKAILQKHQQQRRKLFEENRLNRTMTELHRTADFHSRECL